MGQEREAARTLFKSQAGKELLAQAAAVRARVALVPPQGENCHRGVLYRVVGSCLAKLWKALFLWERASRQLNVPSWRYDPLTRFQPRRLIAGSFCLCLRLLLPTPSLLRKWIGWSITSSRVSYHLT